MTQSLLDQPIRNAVQLAPVIASEVKVGRDLWRVHEDINDERLQSYLPTETSRRALRDILSGTSAATQKRVHLVTGSYGTGKSYLLLVLANLLGRSLNDERLATLLARIRDREERYQDGLTREVNRAHELGGYEYLVIVPDYSDQDFRHAMLFALRKALREEGLNYRPRTEFAAAKDLLETWRQNKPDFIDELRRLLHSDASSLERLEARLDEYDPEAFARFQHYVEDITSMPPTFNRIKLDDTYLDVARYIKKQGKRGIAVLFDEFGAFLAQFVNHPDGAAGVAIQDFIEFAKSEREAQILVVLAAHRTLEDYVTGRATKDDIKKIEGRFEQEHRLRVASRFNEAEEMIAGALVTPTDTSPITREAVQEHILHLAEEEGWLRHMAGWYQNTDDDWLRTTLIQGAYPLHPATMLALPPLSEHIGQNTRTMFKFMAPSERDGLARFIETQPILGPSGRLNLFTVERLFDYFIAPVDVESPRPKDAEATTLMRHYKRAEARLQTGAGELATRVLKAIAVLTLLADRRLQATPENLRWVLNLAPHQQHELNDLLEVLAGQGAIRQNRNTKIYGFRSSGDTSIESLLAKHRERILERGGPDLLKCFREAHPLPEHDPFSYNDKHFTNRRVHFDYLTPASLKETAARWKAYAEDLYEQGNSRDYVGNVIVLYGLIEDEHERTLLLKALDGFSAKLKPYLVVAVSSVPQALSRLALDLESARSILSDPKAAGNDDLRDEAEEIIEEFEARLARALKQAVKPENFAWYYNGEQRYDANELGVRERDQFLDRLVEGLFPQTPVISETTIQYYETGRISSKNKKARHRAIDEMLDDRLFTFSGTSQEEAMLEGLLRRNKMFVQVESKSNTPYGKVQPPPPEVSAHAAWKILEDRLLTTGHATRKHCHLDEVAKKLYNKPFGMSPNAVEFLLGAFIAFYKDGFTIIQERGYKSLPFTAEHLANALASPGRYTLRYLAITPAEQEYLKRLNNALSSKLDLVRETASLGPWEDVANKLLEWYEDVPAVTRHFIADRSKKGSDLLEALKIFRGQGNAREAKDFLKIALPACFDVSEQDLETRNRMNDFVKELTETLLEITHFADDFAEQVLRDVAVEVFEETCAGSREFQALVDEWVRHLSPAARQHRYDSEAYHLLRTATRQGDTVDQFLTKLPVAWDMRPYKGWDTKKSRAEYLTTFKQSVQEIKTFKRSPLPVLQRIHNEAFGSEIYTEEQFAQSFKKWYDGLPETTHAELERSGFSDRERYLRDAIIAPGPIEDRFLVHLPERLKVPGGVWPEWHQVAENNLCFEVAEAVKVLTSWKPALSLNELVVQIGDRIWEVPFESINRFDSHWASWYRSLTSATRQHTFDGLAGELMAVLRDERSVSGALRERLPHACGLPALGEARQAGDGEKLVERIVKAYRTIDAWRRPLLEVLTLAHQKLGWADTHGPLKEETAFTIHLREWLDNLPNAPVRSPDFQDHPDAQQLIRWARAGSRWRSGFTEFIDAVDLPADTHSWTDEEDTRFADAVMEAAKVVAAWQPPPEPNTDEVYQHLISVLSEIQTEHQLSPATMENLLQKAIKAWRAEQQNVTATTSALQEGPTSAS